MPKNEKQGKFMDIAEKLGFFWPSFKIYGGCPGFYTYGTFGSLLKLRIENFIRDYYMDKENCLLIEAPLLTIEDPWLSYYSRFKGSKNIIIECLECGKEYGVDRLIKENTGNDVKGLNLLDMHKLFIRSNIKCPECSSPFYPTHGYNIMFKSKIGPRIKGTSVGKEYPGIFRIETKITTHISFKKLFAMGGEKLPLPVIQIGKAFRNERSPSTTSLREFTQAEAQFYINPKDRNRHDKIDAVKNYKLPILTREDQIKKRKPKEMKVSELVDKRITNPWLAYHLSRTVQLLESMGINRKKLICRQKLDNELLLLNTSFEQWDIEFFSDEFGKTEVAAVSDFRDHDLSKIMKFSKSDMRVDINGKNFVPHLIEAAYGIERALLCAFDSCFNRDKKRLHFSFPSQISPYQIAVFPSVKNKGVLERSKEIYELLRNEGIRTFYGEEFAGYQSQDEIGTPYCIICDQGSFKNGDVLIRDRDTQKKARIKIKDIAIVSKKLINSQLDFKNL